MATNIWFRVTEKNKKVIASQPAGHSYSVVLAPVVQKVDNAIHRINHYPLDIAIGFAITYPVDSDLSGG